MINKQLWNKILHSDIWLTLSIGVLPSSSISRFIFCAEDACLSWLTILLNLVCIRGNEEDLHISFNLKNIFSHQTNMKSIKIQKRKFKKNVKKID